MIKASTLHRIHRTEPKRRTEAPLEKFGLRLAAAKSRVIPFSRNAEPGATRFDFLGFEFHWGEDRAGKPHLKRRTSRQTLRNFLKSPVLEKGTPGSVRGRFGQLAVLPRLPIPDSTVL